MQNDNVNTDELDSSTVEEERVVEERVVEERVVEERVVEERVVVEEENNTVKVGQYVGQCKWFNDLLGYGFVTVCDGNEKGKDIFVHHSGIMPLNSNYRTLKKGEYLNFDIINGMNGLQAVHVTGIQGGPLMCDFVSSVKPTQHGNDSVATPRVPTPLPQQRPRNTNNNPSQQPNQSKNGKGAQLGTQWYVVTKTGRKKNLAKYSKEGRTLMKQVKQDTS